LLIGVGDDEDIDVQAANTVIAAREAATIGPAVRIRETDAIMEFR